MEGVRGSSPLSSTLGRRSALQAAVFGVRLNPREEALARGVFWYAQHWHSRFHGMARHACTALSPPYNTAVRSPKAATEERGMDPRDNPYTPGAGTVPPALTGRDTELGRFDVLLERLWRARTAQSQIVTGLRGVGKTVLLNRFREPADERDWVTVEAEIHARTEFGTLMSRLCRRSLYSIGGPRRWGERARRAAEVLKAFTLTVDPAGSVTIGADVEAASGRGDSGLLSDDLTDVFVELGEAAKERKTGVLFLLDEIQFLPRADLEALILALHKTTQRQLPITLVGAGLPQIPKLAGEAKSYAE